MITLPATHRPAASVTASAIEACGLTKNYGELQAVKGIDLRVAPGQIYTLLGPNGAGKTTFIHMLITLLTPDAGSARVAGFDVVRQPAQVRRAIGVTFQETVLDKNLSGRNLLDIHGRLYRMPQAEIKARTKQLAALVELEDALDRPAKTYSGGMKRRLELARGLLTRPQILFLDEPTLGLDPHNRNRIWEYLRRLRQEEGLTILFTTHYMDEAQELADRVGIIDHGQLVAEDSPARLIEKLGADVLQISGTGDSQTFLAALQGAEWVCFTSLHTGATKGEQTVQLGLKTGAGRSLKQVVDLAEQSGFGVTNVNIQRPTLNDVFFQHTGRSLRD